MPRDIQGMTRQNVPWGIQDIMSKIVPWGIHNVMWQNIFCHITFCIPCILQGMMSQNVPKDRHTRYAVSETSSCQ